MAESLSFDAHLAKRLEGEPPLRKSERTRERLRIAAIEVLGDRGYSAMRTADISDRAGLAEGSFYVYFRSKLDITLDIIDEFLSHFLALDRMAGREAGAFETIRQANRHWLHITRANPGLMRCILHTGHEVPEIAALCNRLTRQWHERIVRSVMRRRGVQHGASELMLQVYLLGGMIDELARRLVIFPDEEIRRAMKKTGTDLDMVSDAASMIWFRILYPGDPHPGDLDPTVEGIAAQLLR